MTHLNTNDYYRSREQRERALAEQARDPHIASIHRDMATRYSVLATETALEGLHSVRAR